MPVVLKVLVLAIVQGFCELLPVSSSAHVIIAEKLMALDPTAPAFWSFARNVVLATACTGIVGLGLTLLIERVLLGGAPGAAVEQLFGNVNLIAAALATVGVMIIWSGLRPAGPNEKQSMQLADAFWIGTVQGLCLPFRGFSRSGANISTGLVGGLAHAL